MIADLKRGGLSEPDDRKKGIYGDFTAVDGISFEVKRGEVRC